MTRKPPRCRSVREFRRASSSNRRSIHATRRYSAKPCDSEGAGATPSAVARRYRLRQDAAICWRDESKCIRDALPAMTAVGSGTLRSVGGDATLSGDNAIPLRTMRRCGPVVRRPSFSASSLWNKAAAVTVDNPLTQGYTFFKERSKSLQGGTRKRLLTHFGVQGVYRAIAGSFTWRLVFLSGL